MEIRETLNRFETYLKACGFSRNTRDQYQRTLHQLSAYLEHSNQPAEVEQISKDHLIEFLAYLEESGQKRNTLTVKALTLKKFFGWLKEEREIAADPAERIPVARERKRVPRYLSPAQVETLLNQPDVSMPFGTRDRAMMEVIYSSGLRISEVLDLEIQDIDYEQGFIYVRNGKGGRSRAVPIGATALQWLQRYILEGRRKLEQDCSSLVFLSRSGERLTRQGAAAMIRDYVKRAGLPEWVTAHSLRHACATHMLEGGARVAYIQELLGHTRLNSTMIYMAVRPEGLKQVHTSCHPRS